MLSKTDLQQIQSIVNQEVQRETRKIVQQETRKIIKEELTPVKKDIIQIRKDMKTIINFFDNEYLELRKRIERIEEHLDLPPLA